MFWCENFLRLKKKKKISRAYLLTEIIPKKKKKYLLVNIVFVNFCYTRSFSSKNLKGAKFIFSSRT